MQISVGGIVGQRMKKKAYKEMTKHFTEKALNE